MRADLYVYCPKCGVGCGEITYCRSATNKKIEQKKCKNGHTFYFETGQRGVAKTMTVEYEGIEL